MRTSNARTGKMPGGLGDFILPLSQDSMRNASATTADHAVPCQIQKPFPMMPLDVRAHLPVELVEDFRADELVYDILSQLNIIPKPCVVTYQAPSRVCLSSRTTMPSKKIWPSSSGSQSCGRRR